MKIYVLDPVHESVLIKARENHEVVAYPESRDRDWRNEADALIVRTWVVSREDLEQARCLKIVAKHGVGVDNIDIYAAKELGVIVTNTPSANAISVAEYVVALTLSLYRNVNIYLSRLKEGLFHAEPAAFEIAGKTVGLIGLGDIGGRVAAIFTHGFGAKVVAYDPFASDSTFSKYGAERVRELNVLLESSDIISLHVPLTKATHNLISAEQLRIMKAESILINVSRGGVVNEADLYNALINRVIFAAACDVFVDEPVDPAHPLLSLKNFIGSPHVAGTSNESLVRMGMGALENIEAVLSGSEPKNAV